MIWLGSLVLPRKGSGDKYGASVSTNILSAGIDLNVFANSFDFLNVTTPLADIYAPISSNLKAKSLVPVKQWIKILRSFFYFSKKKVSFQKYLKFDLHVRAYKL